MQKITPCLWFDKEGERAVEFYVALFPNARILETLRYGKGAPMPEGSVLTMSFELAGQAFMILNGGPHYQFSPAISMSIDCQDQAEVDHYWRRLLEGGKAMACGWLTDRYGISWQVVPTLLPKMLRDPDPAKAARVMQAMMQMIKLDVATLQKAYDGL